MNYLLKSLISLALIDLAIVFVAMMQIANGIPTPHIAFWDWQIREVMAVMK